MKKAFVIFALLLGAFLGVMVWGNTTIAKEKDNVQFKETVLLGDKSVVEGVTIQANHQYENYIFWESTYVVGEEPQVSTNYRYNYWGEEENYVWDNRAIDLYTTLLEVRYINAENGVIISEMDRVLQELIEGTAPGQRGEILLNRKDYEDYYLFTAEFYLGQHYISLDQYSLMSQLETYGYRSEEVLERIEKELEDAKAFQEFFKIPVIENEYCRFMIEKDEYGEIIGWGGEDAHSGFVSGDMDIEMTLGEREDVDAYDFRSTAYVATEDAFYFTLSPYTTKGKLVDTSQIPGGYGIYRLPFDKESDKVYPQQLENVYSLSPEEIVCSIDISLDGTELYVFSAKEDTCYFSVLDLATMELKQKIEHTTDVEDWDSMWDAVDYEICDDFLLIFHKEIVVLTKENGQYQIAAEIPVTHGKSFYENEKFNLYWDGEWDWNGKMLLMVDDYYNEYGWNQCSFVLVALDENGIAYLGTYESSLNSRGPEQGNGMRCYPSKDGQKAWWPSNLPKKQ